MFFLAECLHYKLHSVCAGLHSSTWSWIVELPGLLHGFWSCSANVLGLPIAEGRSDAHSSPSPPLGSSAPALDLRLSLVLRCAWAQCAALITRLCSVVLQDDLLLW